MIQHITVRGVRGSSGYLGRRGGGGRALPKLMMLGMFGACFLGSESVLPL